MFLVGVPVAVVMFALTLFLKEVRLRTNSGLERPSEDVALTGAMAGSADAEADAAVEGGEGALGTGVAIG
jgi:hypothetical protein